MANNNNNKTDIGNNVECQNKKKYILVLFDLKDATDSTKKCKR